MLVKKRTAQGFKEPGRTSCYAVDNVDVFLGFFVVLDVFYYCCYGFDDRALVKGAFPTRIDTVCILLRPKTRFLHS